MLNIAKEVTSNRTKQNISELETNERSDLYELGEPLFDEVRNLNESVGLPKIRNYVWYTKTKIPLSEAEFTELENGQNGDAVNPAHSEWYNEQNKNNRIEE